jgi:hypothetical protein
MRFGTADFKTKKWATFGILRGGGLLLRFVAAVYTLFLVPVERRKASPNHYSSSDPKPLAAEHLMSLA